MDGYYGRQATTKPPYFAVKRWQGLGRTTRKYMGKQYAKWVALDRECCRTNKASSPPPAIERTGDLDPSYPLLSVADSFPIRAAVAYAAR